MHNTWLYWCVCMCGYNEYQIMHYKNNHTNATYIQGEPHGDTSVQTNQKYQRRHPWKTVGSSWEPMEEKFKNRMSVRVPRWWASMCNAGGSLIMSKEVVKENMM